MISASIQPSCHSKDCLLQGDLPIYTVDEDIYNVRPSIVLGTSDKFVQLVENRMLEIFLGQQLVKDHN